MAILSARLDRRRWLVLSAWIAVVLAAVPFAARQSENLARGGFTVPGSESEAVNEEVVRSWDVGTQLALVVVPERGTAASEQQAATRRLVRDARGVVGSEIPLRSERTAVAAVADGRPAIVPVGVRGGPTRESEVAEGLRADLGVDGSSSGGVRSYVIGRGALDAAMQAESQRRLEQAEVIGFPLVLLILLMIFGSFAAALLPAVMAVVALLITGAAVYLISTQMLVSVFATNLASMIGIGVAVDYSLFVLVRYREEVAAGRTPAEARERALSTSGVAVVFSGVTVIVALGGLWLIDSEALRSMALGAMIVVAVAVVIAAALLPVLINLLGARVVGRGRIVGAALSRVGRLRRREPKQVGSFWERWTRAVLRRPVLSATASIALLLALAAPVLSVKVGENFLRQLPEDNDTRQGYAQAAALAGPGGLSPVEVVTTLGEGVAGTPEGSAIVADVWRTIVRQPEIVRVAQPRPSPSGRLVLLSATPRQGVDEPATKELVRRLRDELPALVPAQSATVEVGGETAYILDFQDQVFGGLWKIALFAGVLAIVLLTILLRSVVLPLKAALMNLLSIGAAAGVMVVVFQWGWMDGFLGFQSKGFLDTLSLPLVFVIVFGLSMDYHIFLLSRIRERWEHTRDPHRAVAEGVAMTAGPITSAALIMVSVFLVFVFTGLPAVQEVGLGLAVAIGLDATLVRLVLLPSTMELFGAWNWWLPRPFARALPNRGEARSHEGVSPSGGPAPHAT